MRLQGNSSVDWRLLVPPIYPEMEEGGGRKQAGEQHISLGQRQENRTHAVAATHHWPQEDFAVFTWRGKSCLVFWSQLRKRWKNLLNRLVAAYLTKLNPKENLNARNFYSRAKKNSTNWVKQNQQQYSKRQNSLIFSFVIIIIIKSTGNQDTEQQP